MGTPSILPGSFHTEYVKKQLVNVSFALRIAEWFTIRLVTEINSPHQKKTVWVTL